MKTLPSITAAVALILSGGLASAQAPSVNLEWDPSPAPEGVTGYKVWLRVSTPAPAPAAGTPPPATPAPPVITWRLVGQVAAPVTKFTVTKVAAGTSVFAVTACNPGGESAHSNEASSTFLTPPGKLRIITVTVAP